MDSSLFNPARKSEGSKMEYFSFWKPEPLPPKEAKILPVDLQSLGKLREVTEKLFDVPRMAEVPQAPWELKEDPPTMRLQWQVEQGVILRVRTEQGPPKPGEVITIGAISAAPHYIFYRLYVQLFEQFGVTVLDECSHDFLTPKEFRARMAG